MSTTHRTSAKILQHSSGMGAPDTEMVRRRAEELARISGRGKYTAEDWRQAKEELHGGHDFSSDNGEDPSLMVSGRDMIAADVGHHVERTPLGDENIAEELIAEGMDEAEHEQMLAAREKDDQEELDEN